MDLQDSGRGQSVCVEHRITGKCLSDSHLCQSVCVEHWPARYVLA